MKMKIEKVKINKMKIEKILDFQPLDLAHAEYVDSLCQHTAISDLSFTMLYPYRNLLAIKLARIDQKTAVLVQNSHLGIPQYAIIGEITGEKVDHLVDLGIKKFAYLTIHDLELFNNESKYNFLISKDPNFSDYVYNLDSYLNPKANINRKIRQYERLDVEKELVKMDQNNFADAVKIFKHWSEDHGLEKSVFGNELESFLETKAFLNDDFPNYQGFILYEDQVPVGFSTVEIKGGMLISPYYKMINKHNGVTLYLHRQCFQNFKDQCQWLNLEEDLGLSGLRFFKQKLNPTLMIHKYEATLIR